jgi:hypothetical protein
VFSWFSESELSHTCSLIRNFANIFFLFSNISEKSPSSPAILGDERNYY